MGVLTYEVIVGHPPFATGDDGDLNYNKLIKKICETNVAFPNLEMHDIAMSKECKDFIFKCLKKDPAERLGAKNGLQDIIGHPWFNGIDIEKMTRKEIPMPREYKPELSDNVLDLKYFSNEFTDLPKRETQIGESTKQFIKKNAHLFKDFSD